MKFVTVMDMWLLIINMILLGLIGYYGRKLIKSVETIGLSSDKNKEIEVAKRERFKMLSVIDDEISVLHQQLGMLDKQSVEYTHLNDNIMLLDNVKNLYLNKWKDK
jgi:hypothetical protein